MMETKKLAVVVATMAAMTAATAVPAFAQEGSIPPVGPSGQYAPAGPTQQASAEGQHGSLSGAPAGVDSGKQTTITGPFSVKEGGWSFVTDEKTGQDYYLAGVIGVDPEATAGERVVAKGEAWCGYDGPVYGCTLGVSSITPIGGGAEQEAAPEKETAASDQHGQEKQAATSGNSAPAVVSGDTSNANKGGGSVDVGTNASADASASASGGGTVHSSASPAAKVLPSTGGILPVAGLAGIVLIVGGLLVRRIFR
ncbi:MAG: hypothetical protein M3Q49_10610 [Actinomycetota bacterium]|nr:hypothetical protein [Actinomycetota bacterium]